MHTLLVFLAWPNGAVWGNVGAMPVCGLVAGFFAFVFRDHIGRALKGWVKFHFGHHAELDRIRAALDAHADLLNPETPGGMAAVIAELRQARMAAESAQAATQALSAIARPAPRRGATPMQNKTTGKADGS